MGDSYTDDTFDKSVIPRAYAKDIVETVVGAVHLGWRLYINGSSMTLEAPESANAPQGKRRIHFSTRRNSGPIQRLRAQIAKYGDPVKKGLAQSVAEGVLPRSSIPSAPRSNVVIEEPRNCRLVRKNEEHRSHVWFADDDAEMRSPFACGGLKITRRPPLTPAVTPAPVENKEQEVSKVAVTVSKVEKRVVSTQPMMAHRGGGMSYPSETTLERTWSDGSVDYLCAFCKGFDSLFRKGVAGHYQTHVHKGEVQSPKKPGDKKDVLVPDPTYTEPAFTRAYTPRKQRVEALVAALMDLGLDTFKTPQQLAEAVAKASLQWVHEQSSQGTRFAAEHEDLSDADILTRIRSLLDQGEYMSQRERLVEKEQELDNVRSQLADAESRATRAEERFQAFRELVNEESA